MLWRLSLAGGHVHDAIDWFERAAEAPAPSLDASRKLLYDLGDTLETAQIRLTIDADNLCVRFEDKARGDAYLTTVCPADLAQPFKGINVDPASTSHVYGLGQQFTVPGSADGDWTSLGLREGQGDLGNGFAGFEGGAVDNREVIEAQNALAVASDSRLEAVYQYNLSRLELARARGDVRAILAEQAK